MKVLLKTYKQTQTIQTYYFDGFPSLPTVEVPLGSLTSIGYFSVCDLLLQNLLTKNSKPLMRPGCQRLAQADRPFDFLLITLNNTLKSKAVVGLCLIWLSTEAHHYPYLCTQCNAL